MSDLRRLVSRLRRRVQESTAAVRGPVPGPTVTVVVAVHGHATFLPDCLDSVLASGSPVGASGDRGAAGPARPGSRAGHRGRRAARRPPGAGAAPGRSGGVRSRRRRGLAQGDYLTFVDADDVVPPDALGRLVEALETSGSDLALGPVHTVPRRGRPAAGLGRQPLRRPADRPAGRRAAPTRSSASRSPARSCARRGGRRPGSRSATGPRGSWPRPGPCSRPAASRSCRARPTSSTSATCRCRSTSRPASTPTSSACACRCWPGWRRPCASRTPAVYRRWLVLTLTHVVPPLLVDAVGGGPAGAGAAGPAGPRPGG